MHKQHWTQPLRNHFLLVAEVKVKSPYQSTQCSALSPVAQLKFCSQLGDVVSIHTNEDWGGSWEWLATARKLTDKPILAKGFHPTQTDINRAFNCGADFVLTVGWWNGDARCWHECESIYEVANTDAEVAVWNSRNPRTGLKKVESIVEARKARAGWLIQASNITTPLDVYQRTDGVLIGAGLFSSQPAQRIVLPRGNIRNVEGFKQTLGIEQTTTATDNYTDEQLLLDAQCERCNREYEAKYGKL